MADAPIDAWLEPLADDTTGADLEYDLAFLEMGQAASGKPETQFGAAEPPSWSAVRDLAAGLFENTRDLRVALLWGRAEINLEGLEGVGPALSLLHGLLDRFWEQVHPRPDPDDGDTFARVSVLAGLDSMDNLLGDVRQALLLSDRRLGGLRVRDVEIALGDLAPRDDESSSTPGQIEGTIGETPELSERIRAAVESALQALKQLQSTMNDRFGIETAIDVKALRAMLNAVQSVVPAAGEPADGASADEGGGADAAPSDAAQAPAPPPAGRRGGASGGGVQSVESRQDAVRAINLICGYLERSEPTNPAQLLLRRAERLIDKNFLQLVYDFAPDAVNDVARILGIDPQSVKPDSGSY